MGPRRRSGSFATTLLVATTLVATGPVAPTSEATVDALQDLGFEESTRGQRPATPWTVGPDADGAMVVDVEDGSDSPTYASTGTVVHPSNGQQMLRLGTPKQVAETQPPGPTTVAQTFAPPTSDLRVALRVLSWEFRRNDRVTVAATGATLVEPVAMFGDTATPDCPASAPGATEMTCTVTPVTHKGVLADTNWHVLRLRPVPGVEAVTLTYTVEGTSNSSHATWAYFDDVDVFSDVVFEGQVVRLRDLLGDDRLPGDITSWSWRVTGPGTDLSSVAPDPTFVPPDQGSYDVTLTTGPEQETLTASLEVTNTPPLVNALDAEVLPGAPVPFLARYLDAGWLDEVDATVTTDPTSVVELTSRDTGPTPALRRGEVTGTLAPGTASAAITVDDGQGELAPGSTATVDVTTVDPDARRTETAGVDDDVDGAPFVPANLSRLSWLQEAGDVDVVQVGLPGITEAGGTGPVQQLLPGTEVIVALDQVPADYDLVVLARSTDDTETAPYQMAPYQMAPYQMAPYQMAPYQMAPYQMAPYQMAPYQMAALGLSPYQMAAITTSPYQMAPYQLAPLSTDEHATASGTGGGDIDPAELAIEGLLSADPSLRVAGFSATRGPVPESVLVRIEEPGTELFAVVLGADGAHDATAPYRMRLESSVPFSSLATAAPTIADALAAEVCAPRTVALEGTIAPRYPTGYTPSATPRTVIVTQLDRLRPLASSAEWEDFLTALGEYAASVDGQIVSIAPAAYDGWDAQPCSVEAANDVTDTVRAEVLARAGAAEYLVIVGSDDVVPFRRVASGVVIGDEAQYLGGSFLRPGSPLAAALATSHELTDDFHSDPAPRTFQTGELHLPSLATGRLVETPAEITGQLRAFATSSGLDATSALVTAHDFLADGGEAIASAFADRTQLVADTTETWDADSLRCRWLGDTEACRDPHVAAEPALVSPNAHWTHYASLSADGWSTRPDGLTDVLTSQEVGDRPADAPQLVFTIGCHAGFNVPDTQSLSGDGYGIDPALDFAQALARRQAVFVASTGFGLGETEGLAGTERLMADFAEELLVDGVSAGQALRAAKHAYLGALSTVSTYDVKSLVQQTLYGIPHYTVFGDAAGDAATATTSPPEATTSASFTFLPTVVDGDRVYWTVEGTDGDVQITPGRPWQPRTVLPVDDRTRGVLVTGGTVHDVPNVTAVVSRPTMEWEVDPDPTDVDGACRNSWWPADLATVNDGQVVLVPGQFRCHGDTPGTGTQRLYDTLDLELLTSDATDRTPPTAGPLQLRTTETGAEATFPASDTSGIATIVPLVIDPATGTLRSERIDLEGTDRSSGGPYTVPLPGVTPDHELVVQVVDGANNVTTLTGRGANLRLLDVEAHASMLTAPDPTVEFTFTLPRWTTADGPVSYHWDFGDDTGSETGIVDAGSHTTTYTYADPWTERTATLHVRDANGGTATVEVPVRTCDPVGDVPEGAAWADLVGCGVALGADEETVTFSVHLAAPVDAQGSYRVEITTGSGRKTTTTKLKYDHASQSASGARSLGVVLDDGGRTIRYTVALADLGLRQPAALSWMAEVQAGISGVPTAGFVDRMPDAGLLSWSPPSS